MNHRDAIEALPDALAERWGVAARLPHPLAGELIESPLGAVAIACGRAAYAARGGRPGDVSDLSMMGSGMGTSDFKNALSGAARRLAVIRYDEAAEHIAMCVNQKVRDFKDVEFPGADVDLDIARVAERAERTSTRIVATAGQTARLDTYARDIFVSRETVINDDVGMLGGVFGAIGTSAARTESKMVAALIEGNPTLADGDPMFVSSNIVAQALSASSLGEAMSALRLQPTPAGNVANNRAGVLVVSGGLELLARTILHAAGVDMTVVCLPWLTSGRWYLMASPKVAPVVGRLVFDDTPSARPILVGPGRTPPGADGFVLTGAADLGVVALGRVGIVRGGV